MTTAIPASESGPARARAGKLRRLGPALEAVLALVTVAGVVLGVTKYIATPWAVSGSSMSPTLRHGDRVVVDLWTYHGRPPRPGEVVLFEGPRGVPMVKRVVGSAPPGAPTLPLSGAASPGEELLWVLGDNREASVDSREFGPVPRHRFRGRLLWRYWPWERAGTVH